MANEVTTNHFPHVVLTPLANSRPTVAALRLLHQELNANAIAIPSRRGNGALGHFRLVVPAAEYLARATVPFVEPTHPGNVPEHAAGATGPQITETNRQFLADSSEYQKYLVTRAALQQQILTAVPSTYTNSLKDDIVGFAEVTPLQILEHLDAAFGKITPNDLEENTARLHREWNPVNSIETLFEQVRLARKFAEAVDPISEKTAIRAMISNLEKTGVFTDALRDWRKRPIEDGTMANFLSDFREAERERIRLSTTIKGAGYHHNASMASKTAPQMAATTTQNPNPRGNTLHYCWTHGLGTNSSHESSTCKTPAEGHRAEATVFNMLGGNNTIHRQRGEKTILPARKEKALASTAINHGEEA